MKRIEKLTRSLQARIDVIVIQIVAIAKRRIFKIYFQILLSNKSLIISVVFL